MLDLKYKPKVILDTDNGDDIDDLFTVYALLNSKDIEIVGIVCSYLNTPLRARQIRHVLKLAGRTDIPVFAGCGNSIRGYHDRPTDIRYWQYSEILDSPEYINQEDNVDGELAIQFLIESAKKYKDELFICEVAPECTLARAVLRDKDAFNKSHIYIMGASFFKKESEWNIECDVDAAKTLFESELDVHYCTLDVTRSTIMSEQMYENFISISKDDYINYLVEATKLWNSYSKRVPTLHDPLTFVAMFEDVVAFEKVEAKMIDERDNRKVYFEITNINSKSNLNISKTIDKNKFFNILFEILNVKDEVMEVKNETHN